MEIKAPSISPRVEDVSGFPAHNIPAVACRKEKKGEREMEEEQKESEDNKIQSLQEATD